MPSVTQTQSFGLPQLLNTAEKAVSSAGKTE